MVVVTRTATQTRAAIDSSWASEKWAYYIPDSDSDIEEVEGPMRGTGDDPMAAQPITDWKRSFVVGRRLHCAEDDTDKCPIGAWIRTYERLA